MFLLILFWFLAQSIWHTFSLRLLSISLLSPNLSLLLYSAFNKFLLLGSRVEDAGINPHTTGIGKVHQSSFCFSNIHFMVFKHLKPAHHQTGGQVVFYNPVSVKLLGWTWKKKLGRSRQLTASRGCASDSSLTWIQISAALHKLYDASKKLRNFPRW